MVLHVHNQKRGPLPFRRMKMVSVLVCISVVAAIIPAAFAEDELAADEPTSSTMTTFTLATTTTANSPTKNTSTIPPSCGLPSCHPADGENLCGSIAALRDECSFEKCYCDGYPDGKACPRYQEQCVDTLEKVDLTPAPTFMPISYGQDSSASATTSVLGAVVGALLVGVLIIFILRRKSKAEALEKAALFRQNQEQERKDREKQKRKEEKNKLKREKASIMNAQPHRMKPMTSLGSLRSMPSSSSMVAPNNVWGAPEETEAEADRIEAEEDAAIFNVLSLDDILGGGKYILGSVTQESNDEYLIVDADFGEDGEDACSGWNTEPVEPNKPSKAEIAAKFASGWFDGTAYHYATEGCSFNPPGADPMPLGVMMAMMRPLKSAFPDWEPKVISVVENPDGSCTVVTQQCIGKMQADLPAMGPFPAVALADASEPAKAETASFPQEIGTFFFSADGTKVASGTYSGDIVYSAGSPTAWFTDRWNKKGDLSDVGFGLLFEWMGVSLAPAADPEPEPEAQPEPEPAGPVDIVQHCSAMFETQARMAKGDVTDAMMAEFGAKFAKTFTVKVNPNDEKPGPTGTGTFADAMGLVGPVWLGFKNNVIKNVSFNQTGEDVVVVTQEYSMHLVDQKGRKITDTGINKFQVVQTCKYVAGSVVEWTQEFDSKKIDRVRAVEARWKDHQKIERVSAESLKAAASLNAGKDEKLAKAVKDANASNGADSPFSLMQLFHTLDPDSNSQISKAELAKAWPDAKPKIIAQLAKTDGLLEGIDHDNDGNFEMEEFWDYANEATTCDNPGYITPQEFNAAIGLCSKSAQLTALLRMPFQGTLVGTAIDADPKRLKKVSIALAKLFDSVDKNHDGNLSLAEITNLFAHPDNPAYKEIQTYMKMVDKDHDGVVSIDEFMLGADKDGSGTVTQFEFVKAMAEFAGAKVNGGSGSGMSALPSSSNTLASPTKDRPKGPEKRLPTRKSRGPSVTEEEAKPAPAPAPAKKEEPVAEKRELTTEEKIAESAKIAAAEGREMTRAEKNGAGTASMNDTMANLNEMKFDFSFGAK